MSQEWLNLIATYDKSNMLELLLQFESQVREAVAIGEKTKIAQPKQVSSILVAGMGGSAIGGNILQKLFTSSGTVASNVIRDYRLPAWAGRNSLVVVSSFSGNTEETIAAYESAISKGCPCIVCTSGGKILEIAKQEKHPVVVIPSGRPPRTALGFLLFPLLVNFVSWGFIKSSLIDYDELYGMLNDLSKACNPDNPDDSAAFGIARMCLNRLLIIYTSGEMGAVGMRWKGQISENSKILAYHSTFPEMNHNEIVGWQRVATMQMNEKLAVIFLRDRDDHPLVQKRMEIVRELISQSQTPIQEVHSVGESLLARMFYLLYLADFVSFYLAMLNQEDPTPIKNIDYLKLSLANSGK